MKHRLKARILGVVTVCLLATMAWGDTIEFVTFFPTEVGNITGDLSVDGRLGVNTTNPAGPLQVFGEDNTDSVVSFLPGAGTGTLRVGIGTAAPTSDLQISSTGLGGAVLANFDDTDTNRSILRLNKAAGTEGTPANVVDGEILGSLIWSGFHTGAFVEGSEIVAVVDGTPGPSDMPTELLFRTTADGASNVTTRMAIKANGRVGIGTTTPGNTLDVIGGAAFQGNHLFIRNPLSPANQQTWGFVINTVDGLLNFGQATDVPPNGGLLTTAPFQIRPGAPSSSVFIQSTGAVGIGTATPTTTPSPANGLVRGNLDANDIFLRSTGQFVSQTAGGNPTIVTNQGNAPIVGNLTSTFNINLPSGRFLVQAYAFVHQAVWTPLSFRIDGTQVQSVNNKGDQEGTGWTVLFGVRTVNGGRTVSVQIRALGGGFANFPPENPRFMIVATRV